MSYIYFPHAKSTTKSHHFPWLLFLFVGIALLGIFQWPLQIHSTPDDYNVSDVIPLPGSDGPVVREVLLLALCTVAIVSLVKRPGDPRMRINGLLGWVLISFAAWTLMSILWTQ